MNVSQKMGHGFVLGKFMPLHAGHMHLLRFAASCSESLTILVCSLPHDPIPGELRYRWVKELFPMAHVKHLSSEIPQDPSEHADFWNIWRTTIQRLVPKSVDVVYASEGYGWRLAKELAATFMPVDIPRTMVPMSGTKIRSNPYKNWEYLPAPVRAYYTKRILVVGPESVGKSTLVKRLANHFKTIGVEEYARPLFDEMVRSGRRNPGEFRYEDLSVVARGQQALEESLQQAANRVLFCDTDVLTTMTWSDYLYGTHEPWIEKVALTYRYDATFLLPPVGTLYVQDGQRIMEKQSMRIRFTAQLEKNLKWAQRPYTVLSGSYDDRYRQAVALTKQLF